MSEEQLHMIDIIKASISSPALRDVDKLRSLEKRRVAIRAELKYRILPKDLRSDLNRAMKYLDEEILKYKNRNKK